MRLKTVSLVCMAVLTAIAPSLAFAEAPSAPGNLRAEVYSTTAGEIFWSRSTDTNGVVTGYEILQDGASVATLDALSFFADNLTDGVTSTFSVIAIDNDGERSDTVSVDITGGAQGNDNNAGERPLPPANLFATVYSTTAAEVFFDRNTNDVLTYEVSLNSVVVATIDGTSFFFGDLSGGQVIDVDVVAIDGNGLRSDAASVQFNTTGDAGGVNTPVASAIDAPSNLSLEVYSATAGELFWDRSSQTNLIDTTEILRDGQVIARTSGTSFFDATRIRGVAYRYDVTFIGFDGDQSDTSTVDETGGIANAPENTPDTDTPTVDDIEVVDNTIIVPDDGDIYQVQDSTSFESFCEGLLRCEVVPGTYNVINLSSGDRFEGIVVSGTDVAEPGIGDGAELTLQLPEFRGELVFKSEQRVDLVPLLASTGLERPTNIVVARNGQTVRADLVGGRDDLEAIVTVNTETLTAELLATDLSDDTTLVFDANNNPVAVFARNCADVSFTPLFNDSVVDLTSVIEPGQCLRENVSVSADGNVIIFYTFTPGVGDFGLDGSSDLRAYTLNTASLTPVIDFTLDVDGTTVFPILPVPFNFDQILSDDGRHFFAKQFWIGTDANGNTVRVVGAILFDTVNATFITRGRADDLRTCVITQSINCDPPYFYAMSLDGERQYFSVPTSELLPDGIPTSMFVSELKFSDTGSLSESLVGSDTGSILSLGTNADGRLVVLQAGRASETAELGFAVLEPNSGTLLSLNDSFNECELLNNNGISIDDSRCAFTDRPFSTSRDTGEFTASGRQLLFPNISRFSPGGEQSVENFLLDVNESALFILPPGFNADTDSVSEDATVFVGNTEFPDFEVVIGRR